MDGLTTAAYALAMIYAARGVGAASCVLLAALMAGLYCRGRIYAVRYGEKRRRLEIRASGMVSTMFGSYKEIRIDARRGNLLEKYRRASGECARIQKDYDFTRGLQGVVLRDVMQSALFVLLAALLAAGLELGSILPQALIFITLLTRMLPVSKRIVEALTGLRFCSGTAPCGGPRRTGPPCGRSPSRWRAASGWRACASATPTGSRSLKTPPSTSRRGAPLR